jgi:anti-sigma factor RsiW
VSEAGRLLMNRNTGARPGVFGRKSASSNWCDRCDWRLAILIRRSVAAPSMARGFSSSTVKARCSGCPGDRPYTVSRKRPRISSRRGAHCAGVPIARFGAAARSGSLYAGTRDSS